MNNANEIVHAYFRPTGTRLDCIVKQGNDLLQNATDDELEEFSEAKDINL